MKGRACRSARAAGQGPLHPRDFSECEQLPIDNPPTTGQVYSMPIRDYNPPPPRVDQGKAFAFFGDAQLCHTLDGRTFLRGGSAANRKAALEWFTLFMPDKKLDDPKPAVPARVATPLSSR